MRNTAKKTVLLIDDANLASGSFDLVYAWSGYEDTDTCKSLFLYIEKNAARLRLKHQTWLDELSQLKIGNQTVTDWFRIEPNFSYWWMTLVAEKSLLKSPHLADVIRLIALEEILLSENISELHVRLTNPHVVNCLREYAKRRGLLFVADSTGSLSCKEQCVLKPLRHFIYALGYLLIRFIKNWRLLFSAHIQWKQSQARLLIGSYLLNLDFNKLEEGVYRSDYWGDFNEILNELKLKSHWLEHTIPQRNIQNSQQAVRKLATVNHHSSGEIHTVLDEFLSFRDFPNILWRYFLLGYRYVCARSLFKSFFSKTVGIKLWPILKNDFEQSFLGPTCIENLVVCAQFNKAFKVLAPQKLGVYLCENISWERAFCYYWKKHQHGVLVGVPHSTVRFWDLRYLTSAAPAPDLYAVNGAQAKHELQNFGVQAEKLVPVEALRYSYLATINSSAPQSKSHLKRVLIIGDYSVAETNTMFGLAAETLKKCTQQIEVSFKAHPAQQDKIYDQSLSQCAKETRPLKQALGDYDLVICGNLSTAGLEAYLLNKQVFVFLSPHSLNLSPLRGKTDVSTFASSEQFALIFECFLSKKRGEHQPKVSEFFSLDPQYHQWRKLIQAHFD